MFAGIMAYYSVAPLVDKKDKVRVGIDSSLCQASEIYKKALEQTLHALTKGKGEAVFLQRDHKLSAPNRGAMLAGAMLAC